MFSYASNLVLIDCIASSLSGFAKGAMFLQTISIRVRFSASRTSGISIVVLNIS